MIELKIALAALIMIGIVVLAVISRAKAVRGAMAMSDDHLMKQINEVIEWGDSSGIYFDEYKRRFGRSIAEVRPGSAT
jgi:hypothetical protein